MKYKDYQEKRNALTEEADGLIDEGKIDEANAKMDEIKELDAKWDESAQAQANLRALDGEARKLDISNPGRKPAEDGAAPVDKAGDVLENTKPEELYKTDEYRDAWAKRMMGKPLTSTEKNLYTRANEFIHTTENTGDVIPETVAAGIMSEMEGMFPYFNDVEKTTVHGIFTIIRGKTSSEAKWYDEATPTEDGAETFDTVTLQGCELSRSITVSYKLREMAVKDFIPYIQRKIAEKMGQAAGYGVTNGKGHEEAKPEPMGVVTMLKKPENEEAHVVKYEKGKLSYVNLTAARAKIKAQFTSGLAIYANTDTVWNELANVLDNNGRPVFIPDPTSGGVFKVLGMVVKEDASMGDGDILLSNAGQGYHLNIARAMSMETENHAKQRVTDYVAYSVMDGAVIAENAHALLTRQDP